MTKFITRLLEAITKSKPNHLVAEKYSLPSGSRSSSEEEQTTLASSDSPFEKDGELSRNGLNPFSR